MENKVNDAVENTVKVEKESIKNNSLMRKTKVQLIEIILRKDDVERKLQSQIKDITEKYDVTYKSHTALYNQVNNLCERINKNNYNHELEINDYVSKLKLKNSIIILLSVILTIIIFAYIVQCFL